jgi:two-component sensor histidine kinase
MYPERSRASRPGDARQPTVQHLVRRMSVVSRLTAAAVLILAALTLIAWVLAVPALLPLVRGRAAMGPISAFAFTLASIALLMKLSRVPQARPASAAFAASVCVIGALFLARSIIGHDLGFEPILLRGGAGAFGGAQSPAPAPAALFMALGAALFLLDYEGPNGRRHAQPLCILVALFALAAFGVDLVGYLSGERPPSNPSISAMTAVAFVLLALAALLARPDRGLMRAITIDAPGGEVARMLLPPAMLTPLALCILCYLGFRAKWYDSTFGLILLTTLNSAVLTTLVWRAAGALNQTDERRREVEAERNDLNTRLQRAMAETHHRVRNNLQIISALADMQVTSGRESVPVSEVQRIGSQVQALAAVHDILTREAKSDVGAETLPAAEVLEKLAGLLQQTVRGRSIRVTADLARITGRQASALVVVANELILNALKNSDADVDVDFTADGEGARLIVADYGPGFPPGFDPERDANTGLELVQQIAGWDLQGSVQFTNRTSGGGRVVIDIPLPTSAGPPVAA